MIASGDGEVKGNLGKVARREEKHDVISLGGFGVLTGQGRTGIESLHFRTTGRMPFSCTFRFLSEELGKALPILVLTSSTSGGESSPKSSLQ